MFHLNNHRDSEDLDFDCDIKYKESVGDVLEYIKNIFTNLKNEKLFTEYKINKAEFSAKQRYHISLEITTHKKYLSKIDIDFREIQKEKLLKENKLYLYSKEYLFVSKLITFKSRKNLKDLYDIYFLLKHIKSDSFYGNVEVVKLLTEVIDNMKIEEEHLLKLFKEAFKNTDMNFAHLKEKDIKSFYENVTRELNKLKNQISKVVN